MSGEGTHRGALDLDSNGTLEKRHGQHDTITTFELQQDSFQSAKSSRFNPYPLSDLQEGPGCAREPGSDQRVDGRDFSLRDGNRILAGADDQHHSGRGKNRKPIQRVESAEDIARE